MTTAQNGIREQAELLARGNRAAAPDIEKVYWFPDPEEVRLVETTPEVAPEEEGVVHPFYFPPRPDEGLPALTAIALIRPEEVGRVQLPDEWGGWGSAQELKESPG